jgi:hypothetical protein
MTPTYCSGCGNMTATRDGRCDTCGDPKPGFGYRAPRKWGVGLWLAAFVIAVLLIMYGVGWITR